MKVSCSFILKRPTKLTLLAIQKYDDLCMDLQTRSEIIPA